MKSSLIKSKKILNKNKIVKLLIICFLLVFMFTYNSIFIKEKNGNKVVNLNETLNIEDINYIINWGSNFNDNSGFKIPLENTISDFNTYYGNEIRYLITGTVNENLINEINNIISSESFMEWQENDVFEGVEKLFYFYKLGNIESEKFNSNQIKKYIIDIIEKTYYNGYFLGSEIIPYIESYDEKELLTIKLSHTMQTLYLSYKLDILNNININEISQWLIDNSKTTNKFIDKYYIYKCAQYLDITENINQYININMYDDKIEQLELIELNFYIDLKKENGEKILKENSLKIKEKVMPVYNNFNVSDLQSCYYAVNILNYLGESISQDIIELLHIYSYDNGLFPVITTYEFDNKQLFMYSIINEALGNRVDYKQLNNLINKDYENIDIVDLYSIINLYKNDGQKNRYVMKKLKSNLPKLGINEFSTLYYTAEGLKSGGYNLKKNNFSEEILEYFSLLSGSKKESFDISELMIIDALVDIKDIKNIDSCIQQISKLKVEKNQDLAPLLIYYKYNILIKANVLFDYDEAIDEIMAFRCKGGFKIDNENKFFDLQITYMLIQLLTKIEQKCI